MTTAELLFISDICGTLYQENTTAGFVRYYLRAQGRWLRLCLLRVCIARFLPIRHILIALARVGAGDALRMFHVRSLRGETMDDLSAVAERYVDELQDKVISPAHAQLYTASANGARVVLLSNSLDCVVRVIGRRLGVEAIGSTLASSGEICLGCLERDLKGAKRSALVRHLGYEPAIEQLVIMTDNQSDSDLYQRCARAIFVVTGQPKPWMTRFGAELLHA